MESQIAIRLPEALRPYERVHDLLGSLDSRVSDLGSRHRDHLLAYFRRRG